jgi:glycine dehydrogenase subunit 2
MHEFVASAEEMKQAKGLKQPAMDLGKRLLDFGFHAPTVYFPLTVHDAMMFEPTETESKETLDAFAEALFHVSGESAELLRDAPHSTVISRPDEVAAARKPVLKWTPEL